jgi:hypothetical protein
LVLALFDKEMLNMILDFIEIVSIMVVAGFLLTQIAVPLWRNTSLFPMLRKGRERKLEADLRLANSEIADLKLQLELKAAQKEAEKLRHEARMDDDKTTTDLGSN